MIEKCDFCNCIGSIRKNKEIPYYNTFLYKKLIYKTYKLYTKFYNMKYIEHKNNHIDAPGLIASCVIHVIMV